MARLVAGLNYTRPEHLVVDQWGINSQIYIVYRWSASLYFFAWLVASVAEFTPPKSKYLLNITSWSFILLNITVAFRAVVATKFIRKGSPIIRMNNALKLVWVLENVSSVMALGVTVGYWGLLNRDGKLPVTAVTVHAHGVNGLYVVIDLLLTAKPCRCLHFWHAMTFAIVYLSFSAIYWVAGGTGPQNQPFIYPALDWRYPAKTLLFSFLFGVVLTTFTHAILCCMTRTRLYIHQRLYRCHSVFQATEVDDEEKDTEDICVVVCEDAI